MAGGTSGAVINAFFDMLTEIQSLSYFRQQIYEINIK
jgi:hypothetical protein